MPAAATPPPPPDLDGFACWLLVVREKSGSDEGGREGGGGESGGEEGTLSPAAVVTEGGRSFVSTARPVLGTVEGVPGREVQLDGGRGVEGRVVLGFGILSRGEAL
jgi:hypothetical protein